MLCGAGQMMWMRHLLLWTQGMVRLVSIFQDPYISGQAPRAMSWRALTVLAFDSGVRHLCYISDGNHPTSCVERPA